MTGHAVLLVEDNADDEALTIRALTKHNFVNDLIVARDGAEALQLLLADSGPARTTPGLILLDLKLPKVGGLEVLSRIRADERTRLIPVVVLSSSREREDVLACYSIGANAYVQKPVNFGDFAEAIGTLALFWLSLNENPVDAGAP